jgi:hypothetical protein
MEDAIQEQLQRDRADPRQSSEMSKRFDSMGRSLDAGNGNPMFNARLSSLSNLSGSNHAGDGPINTSAGSGRPTSKESRERVHEEM